MFYLVKVESSIAILTKNTTRRGLYGEQTAIIISNIREALDYYKNIKRGLTPEQALTDKLHDIEANTFGREQAKKYPDKDVHELLKKYWVKDETGQIAK